MSQLRHELVPETHLFDNYLLEESEKPATRTSSRISNRSNSRKRLYKYLNPLKGDSDSALDSISSIDTLRNHLKDNEFFSNPQVKKECQNLTIKNQFKRVHHSNKSIQRTKNSR
jgi:hypothetical protein